MDSDWKEWDVLSSLHVIHPPEFLWLYGYENPREKRVAVIQEHHDSVLDELKQDGYERLVAMRERLESHLSEVNDRLEPAKSRLLYAELQVKGYRRRLMNHAEKTAPSDSALEKQEASLMEVPIGRTWLDESTGELKGSMNDGWEVHATGPVSSSSLRKIQVSYRPSEDILPRYGLHQRDAELNEDHLDRIDKHTFHGGMTWGEVLERVKEHKSIRTEEKNTLMA